MRRIIVQVIAYTLYTLVAFVVCVYVLFPYDLLQQRLTEWLSQDGTQVALSRLRPTFPPGLRAEALRVQSEPLNPDTPLLQIDTIHVQPEWTAILARKLQLQVQAGLYGGRLEADVRYNAAGATPVWEIKSRVAELDIAQHALLRKDDKVFMRGRLSGDVVLTVTTAGGMQDGSVNLRLQAMAFLGVPGWQVALQREIACPSLQGDFKATAPQSGTLSLTCQSKELGLKAEGTVGWKTPLGDSQLLTTWQVRSEETYKQEVDLLAALVRKRANRGELTFRLQGPLRQLRLGA